MAEKNTLGRLARTGHAYSVVSELTRDPDPTPQHAYQRDPQSGAGTCRCGMAERHRRHPHRFTPSATRPDLCTCALPEAARCHATTREQGPTTGERA